MKKTLLTLILASGIATTFSQTINFGIKAGLNLSELTHISQADYGSSLLPGFNAGGIVDIGFANFSIQPGIFYTTKGEKDAEEFVEIYIPSKLELDYIEVPVNFLYKSKLSPTILFNLGGGPYVAYVISETLKVNTTASPNYSNYHHYPYRNPDFGVNLIAGFTIKNKWLIDADYSIGLQNLQTPDTMHNRVVSFSLGYLFK